MSRPDRVDAPTDDGLSLTKLSPPSVGCGACGRRISLVEFELVSLNRMTRSADCPHCGQTTLILLAGPAG